MAKGKTITEKEADLMTILGSAQGRRYLYHLMDSCGLDTNLFNIEHSVMAFNDGKRFIGLQIKQEVLIVDPDAFLLMMRENLKITKPLDAQETDDGEESS